jgi:rRNA-processing protein FCF1
MLEGRLEFCLVGLSFYELDHIGLAESVKNEILKLISEKNFRTIESNNPKADDAIFEFACKNKRDVIVCTNDMLLRKRLQKQGVRTIGLRGKSRLSFY